MPKRDGTGPLGGGPGTGRGKGPCGAGAGRGGGRGAGRGAGQVQGRGSGGLGGAPADECVCVKCGATIKHRRSIPCSKENCPQCGGPMMRK